MSTIDLTGLDKAAVLAVLYNNAGAQGLGVWQASSAAMTKEEAASILIQTTDFDYLKGRVLKVNLSGDTLDSWLYDRDNGAGAAARAIDTLRDKEAK